eukprot:2816640-Pyramimonas_sp.AAC.1
MCIRDSHTGDSAGQHAGDQRIGDQRGPLCADVKDTGDISVTACKGPCGRPCARPYGMPRGTPRGRQSLREA